MGHLCSQHTCEPEAQRLQDGTLGNVDLEC